MTELAEFARPVVSRRTCLHTDHGSLPKNSGTLPRRYGDRSTTARAASTVWIRRIFFARSRPMVLIWLTDGSSPSVLRQPNLAHRCGKGPSTPSCLDLPHPRGGPCRRARFHRALQGRLAARKERLFSSQSCLEPRQSQDGHIVVSCVQETGYGPLGRMAAAYNGLPFGKRWPRTDSRTTRGRLKPTNRRIANCFRTGMCTR